MSTLLQTAPLANVAIAGLPETTRPAPAGPDDGGPLAFESTLRARHKAACVAGRLIRAGLTIIAVGEAADLKADPELTHEFVVGTAGHGGRWVVAVRKAGRRFRHEPRWSLSLPAMANPSLLGLGPV